MSRMKLWTLVGVIVMVSMVLASCAPPPEPETIIQTVVVKEAGEEVVKEIVITTTPEPTKLPEKPKRPNVIRAAFGYGDVPTIDPNLATDSSSITIVNATYVGLTRLNEETSELYPGMATKWDISDDGLVYTFHLRNDVPWVKWNGEEVVKVQDCDGEDRIVNAYDFEYGILRALDPATASDYAYVLAFVIESADAFNSGEVTDPTTVGVKALDEWTLEVKFLEPAAYNANIIGLWTAMPVPRWVIEGDDCTEARGDRWGEPGFFQSYGPFTVKEWIHDSSMTIIKNPFWPGNEGAPQAKVDEVEFYFLDDVPAMAEFEAGNLDWTQVPLADMDRVKADPELSKQLSIVPVMCTYFYEFNTKAPLVEDVRVRRALSLAVDRQGLVDNVTKGGQEPAGWFSRPGLAGAPTRETHPDLGVKYDPEAARASLQEYLDEKSLTVDDLDITLMFNTSSGHQKIAEAIQQMWKDVLGLDVNLTNQEWKVFLKTTLSEDSPQVYRSGWCMDYPDANNFIREVLAWGGSDNPGPGGVNYENPEWNELLKQAAVEMDPARRVEMYAQAEQTLVWEDAVIIPIYWYTNVHLTKPYIKRTYSVGGSQRYERWEVLQD